MEGSPCLGQHPRVRCKVPGSPSVCSADAFPCPLHVANCRSGRPRPFGSARSAGRALPPYGDALMAVAYHITGAASDAEDVLHDVFLGLPESLRRYEERGSLESWLKRITAALERIAKEGTAPTVARIRGLQTLSADSARGAEYEIDQLA